MRRNSFGAFLFRFGLGSDCLFFLSFSFAELRCFKTLVSPGVTSQSECVSFDQSEEGRYSVVVHARFPALFTGCMFLLQVVIGPLHFRVCRD